MNKQEKQHSFFSSFVAGEASFGLWNSVSKVFNLINSFIIIGYLSLYEFGVYQLILALYGIIGSLFLKTLNIVVFNDIARFLGEKKENYAKRLFYEFAIFKIILGIILWLGLFFMADIIAGYYDQNVAGFFRILSFLFLADVFYTLLKILLKARLKFSVIAARPAVYGLIRLVFLLIFIFFLGLGIKEILMIQVLSAFVATIVFLPLFFKQYQIWVNVEMVKESLLLPIVKSYGKWTLLRPFIVSIPNNIRPWLIKFFISTEAVAIFNVALMMFGVVKSVFPVNTLSALIPHEIDNRKKAQKIFSYGIKYLVIFSIFIGVLTFLIAYPFIHLLFPKYISSLPLFSTMLLSLPVFGFGIMIGTFLVALRKQKFLFYQMVIKVSFILVIYFILLPIFGLWGLAVERILTPLFVLTVTYVYMLKIKPGPSIEWKVLFSFDKNDILFLKNVYGEIKKILRKKRRTII